MTSTICTAGQYVNYCLTPIFEVDDVHNYDFTIIALDSATDYVLEVDAEYPQHLHDAHTDLLCPTREKPPGKRNDKLLAILCDKQHYVIHYHNLQQCMVLVTVTVSQRFIVYYNSCNFHGYAII